jgi:uncharacterized phiE125 gp8 family phage protein
MRSIVVVEPSEEPVSLLEVKRHANIRITADDAEIDNDITEARVFCEGVAGRQFVTATRKIVLDGFPVMRIVVPRPPLQSVDSITYTDENGAAQTWSSTLYQVDTDSEPGRIKPIDGESYPSTQAGTYGTVVVTYIAGYGAAAAVPPRYKLSIRRRVAMSYMIREGLLLRDKAEIHPAFSVVALLSQDRIVSF